jgi:penicillin amidase
MKRSLKIVAISLPLLLIVALLGTMWMARRSLPTLTGKLSLSGLSQPVQIERDEAGVPRIVAVNINDAMRSLGFLHAQERFFQMDLLRRRSSGELAALFGAAAVNADKAVRRHRLRARAEATIAEFDGDLVKRIDSYVAGVNAGLNGIGAPPEYLMLRQQPQPWTAIDTLLVIYTMHLNLQDENAQLDSARGLMRDQLPAAALEFLLPAGSEWDAPLSGPSYSTPALPSATQWSPFADETADERKVANVLPRTEIEWLDERTLRGSNSWAVSGRHTVDGRALVANDMHLGLGLPNIWYRALIQWTARDGREIRTSGVTLPGVPGVIAGASDEIAWGFTNSQGDWSDLIELEFEPGSESRYRTPSGYEDVIKFDEVIEVHNGDAQTVTVRETIWGPIIDRSADGIERVSRWIAHDPRGLYLKLAQLAECTSLEQALGIAQELGLPEQNFVVAASDGRIGWTIAGPIPNRFGYDGRFPVSWADGSRGWDGWVEPERVPQQIEGESGFIWTANNRTMHGAKLQLLGDGGYAMGARAKQIRDGLFAMRQVTEQDLLELQLDDRALFLEPWRGRLLSLLNDGSRLGDARVDELRRQLETSWTGRASVDSVGYRMVRAWRRFVADRVFQPLTADCTAVDTNFDYLSVGRFEGPLVTLLATEPAHLLAPEYESWTALRWVAVDDLLDYFLKADTTSLDRFTWGDRNQVAITHPISQALPGFIRKQFDLPTEPLPGDSWMPRVQGRGFGASERFVVSPGHLEDGLFQMPGGQSGHFASPYYLSGHRAWVEGAPQSFLPGETKYRMELHPTE